MTEHIITNGAVMQFILGSLSGIVTDKVISKPINYGALEVVDTPYIHNYQVAIASYALNRYFKSTFLDGLTTTLLIMEASNDSPFGIGDSPEVLKTSWPVTVGLLGFLGMMEAVMNAN